LFSGLRRAAQSRNLNGFHHPFSENRTMVSFLIALFTVILLLVCVFMTVIILMQRSSANAGMGTALGGGAAESVFGGETANVLLKNTVIVAVLFFVLSFGLYLGTLAQVKNRTIATGGLPTFGAPGKAQTLPVIGGNATSTSLPGVTPPPATVPANFVPPQPATTTPATTAPAPASTTTPTPISTSAAPAVTTAAPPSTSAPGTSSSPSK
jgi:preprotein translocase subunit SecG